MLRAADRAPPLSVRPRVRCHHELGRLPSLADPPLFTEEVQWRVVRSRARSGCRRCSTPPAPA